MGKKLRKYVKALYLPIISFCLGQRAMPLGYSVNGIFKTVLDVDMSFKYICMCCIYNYNTTNKLDLKQNVSFESIVLQNKVIRYYNKTT